MATIHWQGGSQKAENGKTDRSAGNLGLAKNWSGGSLPANGDDVFIASTDGMFDELSAIANVTLASLRLEDG